MHVYGTARCSDQSGSQEAGHITPKLTNQSERWAADHDISPVSQPIRNLEVGYDMIPNFLIRNETIPLVTCGAGIRGSIAVFGQVQILSQIPSISASLLN